MPKVFSVLLVAFLRPTSALHDDNEISEILDRVSERSSLTLDKDASDHYDKLLALSGPRQPVVLETDEPPSEEDKKAQEKRDQAYAKKLKQDIQEIAQLPDSEFYSAALAKAMEVFDFQESTKDPISTIVTLQNSLKNMADWSKKFLKAGVASYQEGLKQIQETHGEIVGMERGYWQQVLEAAANSVKTIKSADGALDVADDAVSSVKKMNTTIEVLQAGSAAINDNKDALDGVIGLDDNDLGAIDDVVCIAKIGVSIGCLFTCEGDACTACMLGAADGAFGLAEGGIAAAICSMIATGELSGGAAVTGGAGTASCLAAYATWKYGGAALQAANVAAQYYQDSKVGPRKAAFCHYSTYLLMTLVQGRVRNEVDQDASIVSYVKTGRRKGELASVNWPKFIAEPKFKYVMSAALLDDGIIEQCTGKREEENAPRGKGGLRPSYYGCILEKLGVPEDYCEDSTSSVDQSNLQIDSPAHMLGLCSEDETKTLGFCRQVPDDVGFRSLKAAVMQHYTQVTGDAPTWITGLNYVAQQQKKVKNIKAVADTGGGMLSRFAASASSYFGSEEGEQTKSEAGIRREEEQHALSAMVDAMEAQFAEMKRRAKPRSLWDSPLQLAVGFESMLSAYWNAVFLGRRMRLESGAD